MSRGYSKPLDYIVDFVGISSTKINPEESEEDKEKKILVLHDDSKDIMRWNAINVYEDIFRNFMTCEIAILDQDGQFLDRMRTEEMITIKFRTPGLPPRTHYFYLYKINPIIPLDKIMGAQYVIHGISVEFFSNSLRAFSKSYSGKTEDIVDKIYDEFLKQKGKLAKPVYKGYVEDSRTKHEMKFSFPYVNPVEAINHLASVSVNDRNPLACNYIFYENQYGFWYTCLEEIFKNPGWGLREEHSYSSSQTLTESYLDPVQYFYNTIRVEPQNTGDKIIDTIDGVYGEYFSEFDLLYKKYTPFVNSDKRETDYLSVQPAEGKRYLDYFEKTAHVERSLKPLLSKQNEIFQYPLGRNRVCFTNGALYSDPIKDRRNPSKIIGWKLYQTHEGEYSFSRRSQMQQINLFTVQITVPGNSRISVGDTISLNASIYRSGSGTFLGGKYLVISVAHKIVPAGYQSIVTLARDGVKVEGI